MINHPSGMNSIQQQLSGSKNNMASNTSPDGRSNVTLISSDSIDSLESIKSADDEPSPIGNGSVRKNVTSNRNGGGESGHGGSATGGGSTGNNNSANGNNNNANNSSNNTNSSSNNNNNNSSNSTSNHSVTKQKESSGRKVFMLSGRRRKKSKTYLIGNNAFDISRQHSLAKLKSNVIGTQFTAIRIEPSGGRHEVVSVTYETNVLGFKGPRKMTVIVPKPDEVNYNCLCLAK